MNNIEQLIIMQSIENGSFIDDLPDIISEHKTEVAESINTKWQEYCGKVPILSKEVPDNKPNNKLIHHFRKFIVDMICGYAFGHEIVYKVSESNYSANDYKLITDELKKFKARNKIAKLDLETATYQSATGVAYRLCYIDKLGKERVMNINPSEVIYIEDATINEVQLAIIYYPVEYKDSAGKSIYKTKVEVYDKQYITYYIEDNNNTYVLDMSEPVNPQPHMFDYVPVIRFQNNIQYISDFDDVTSLIDAYDNGMSNIQDEIDYFKNAYLALGGVVADDKELDKMKQSGTILLPENGKAEFLTKNVQDTLWENQKKSLEQNIFRISHAIDFTDDNFSNNSGESRQWKLINLENKTIKKELEYRSGLQDMFKVICSAWTKRGLKLDYEDIDFVFTRNLPKELLLSADICTKFGVTPSKKTVLSLMPFIDDVDAELEQISKEQSETSLNLDDFNFMPSGSVA